MNSFLYLVVSGSKKNWSCLSDSAIADGSSFESDRIAIIAAILMGILYRNLECNCIFDKRKMASEIHFVVVSYNRYGYKLCGFTDLSVDHIRVADDDISIALTGKR